MHVAGRPIAVILSAPFRRSHYVAALNMFRVYEKPLEAFGRYLFGLGNYPTIVNVKTPMGPVSLKLHTFHDLLTVNEIFCRGDYCADSSDEIVVDFGSNIGISAAYFLTRTSSAFAYLFEPLPQNVERLKENLRRFSGRYEINGVAIGMVNGEVQFGWEETGRYGGVGRTTGQYVRVQCRDSNEILAGIIEKHGRIDLLKIDVETLEREIIERIPKNIARRIRKIYVEYVFKHNPLAETHSSGRYSNVARFRMLA